MTMSCKGGGHDTLKQEVSDSSYIQPNLETKELKTKSGALENVKFKV